MITVELRDLEVGKNYHYSYKDSEYIISVVESQYGKYASEGKKWFGWSVKVEKVIKSEDKERGNVFDIGYLEGYSHVIDSLVLKLYEGKLQKFNRGDKVVPLQKTVDGYGNLDKSVAWKAAKELDQPFLYVLRYDDKEGYYSLRQILSDYGGDFFNEEDLVLFDEEMHKKSLLKYHLKEIEKMGFVTNLTEDDNTTFALIVDPLDIDVNSTKDIPEFGDLFELDEFIDMCESGSLIDYDGYGDIVYNNKIIHEIISPSDVDIYKNQLEDLQEKLGKIQIMWYNK